MSVAVIVAGTMSAGLGCAAGDPSASGAEADLIGGVDPWTGGTDVDGNRVPAVPFVARSLVTLYADGSEPGTRGHCSAVRVAPNLVLTAIHCVVGIPGDRVAALGFVMSDGVERVFVDAARPQAAFPGAPSLEGLEIVTDPTLLAAYRAPEVGGRASPWDVAFIRFRVPRDLEGAIAGLDYVPVTLDEVAPGTQVIAAGRGQTRREDAYSFGPHRYEDGVAIGWDLDGEYPDGFRINVSEETPEVPLSTRGIAGEPPWVATALPPNYRSLGPGDSGGPGYVRVGETWAVYGVNSGTPIDGANNPWNPARLAGFSHPAVAAALSAELARGPVHVTRGLVWSASTRAFDTTTTDRAGRGGPLAGGSGADQILALDQDDEVRAGEGADLVRAGKGQDVVFGEGGDDALFGDRGADTLDGGDGTDFVFGGKGNDRLIASAGLDMLSGDLGADVYVFGDRATGEYQVYGGAGDVVSCSDGVGIVSQRADGDDLLLLLSTFGRVRIRGAAATSIDCPGAMPVPSPSTCGTGARCVDALGRDVCEGGRGFVVQSASSAACPGEPAGAGRYMCSCVCRASGFAECGMPQPWTDG